MRLESGVTGSSHRVLPRDNRLEYPAFSSAACVNRRFSSCLQYQSLGEIRELAEARLALAQLVLRALALGVVDERTQHADPAAVLDSTAMHFDREHRAVLAQSAEFVAHLFDIALEPPAHVLRDEGSVIRASQIR